MFKPEDITFSVPRFLSFIDLTYLYEGVKVADEHFASKIANLEGDDKRNEIGNINATRQSLLRSVFISSYAILEQNLDELISMNRSKGGVSLSPNDLKHRGITRSLVYAKKVLGKEIDQNSNHWKNLLLLQEIRNHLIHYGPGFNASSEHKKRFEKFSESEFVLLREVICFTIEQIEKIINLYMQCVDDFNK